MSLNFLTADDRHGTHKSFLRVAVFKMDALRLITHFEAGKVQLNLSFMSNYLLHVEILPFSTFTYSQSLTIRWIGAKSLKPLPPND